MTFWRNVLPNILLQGQNAVLVVKKTPQNFYQCTYLICMYIKTLFQGAGYSGRIITKLCTDFLDGIWELKSTTWNNIRAIFKMCDTYYISVYVAVPKQNTEYQY